MHFLIYRAGADQLLIVPGAKKKGTDGSKDSSQVDQAEPALSKGQLRKLKQIQMKKERRENLANVSLYLA